MSTMTDNLARPEAPIIDGWMEIDAYCEKYGQRKNTVQKRVHDGTWPRGLMYASPSGGVAYVHVERCNDWLQARGKLKL
jgi:hypothetical protein